MSLLQLNGIVGRTGLWSRKALALFVVLVLSGVALVFAAGEAHAQQRPAPKVHATVTGPERMPVSERGRAEPVSVKPASGTLPVGSSPSQVDERDAGSPSGSEPDLVIPGAPEPALALLEELYPASWTNLVPETAMPDDFGITFGPDPVYDLAAALLDPGPQYRVPFVDPPPAPGLAGFGPALPYLGAPESVRGVVASEENKPPSPRVEERPLTLSPTGTSEGVRPAPRQENEVVKAVPVGSLPPVADRKAPPPALALEEPAVPAPPVTDPSREAALLLSGLEAAASGAVETLHGAAVDVSEALTPGGEVPAESPSGGGTKQPLEDAPSQPPAALGGSYFSPLVGGQVGPGGVVPLLICVLAAGLILLRPFVGRLLWASCELPKPSSVLLLPLERPG